MICIGVIVKVLFCIIFYLFKRGVDYNQLVRLNIRFDFWNVKSRNSFFIVYKIDFCGVNALISVNLEWLVSGIRKKRKFIRFVIVIVTSIFGLMFLKNLFEKNCIWSLVNVYCLLKGYRSLHCISVVFYIIFMGDTSKMQWKLEYYLAFLG